MVDPHRSTTRGRLSSVRWRSISALAAGAVLLSGCSAIGIEENTFESGPLPALADSSVPDVLAGIDEVVNAANGARDPELLATVVADPLLAVETARYALDATADPDNADPLPTVKHTDPTVFVPQFEGYPQWVLVAATLVPETPTRLEVLSRDSASAQWITSMSTDLLPGVEFPTLALDDAGYVVPVASDASELPVELEELAEAHVAALNGEAASGPGEALAEDAWTVERQTADAARATTVGEAATVAARYQVAAVLPQLLRTQDGGAFGFYAVSEHVAYTVTPNYFLRLDAATAALAGKDEVTTSLTEDWWALLGVYLPPDENGAARVVAARFDRVGLAGT